MIHAWSNGATPLYRALLQQCNTLRDLACAESGEAACDATANYQYISINNFHNCHNYISIIIYKISYAFLRVEI
jgi:hypothetical protein